MSYILTKTIARAGQVVTLLGAAGFPVSQVCATRSGIEAHLDPDAPNRSAWAALAVTGMAATRVQHFTTSVPQFTVARGTYKGTPVTVYGEYDPYRPEGVAA